MLYMNIKCVAILLLIFKLSITENCVVITKTFYDDTIPNCIISINFSYYLTNDGTLIYQFNGTVKSDLDACKNADLCLQIDRSQIVTEGQCSNVKLKNKQTILSTVGVCSSNGSNISFIVYYSDTDFTFNVTDETYSNCSDHCEFQGLSHRAPSIYLYNSNRLLSSTPSTGPFTPSLDTSTTTSPDTDLFPPIVIPPLPPPKPDNCDISLISRIFCKLLNNINNSILIDETIKWTKATLNHINITSDDLYYAGAVLAQALRIARKINPTTTNNTLDIISRVAIECVQLLMESNKNDSILWFSSAIPDLIAKTDHHIEYENVESGLFVQSFNQTEFCNEGIENYEECFKGSRRVQNQADVTSCIVIPITDALCKSKSKWYILITPMKLYALGSDNISNGTISIQVTDAEIDNNSPPDEAGKCNCKPSPVHSSAFGFIGINDKSEIETTPFKLIIYHSIIVNDLHRKTRMAYIAGQNFQKGSEAFRFPDRYEIICNASTCTASFEGCSSDPIACSTLLKIIACVMAILTAFFIIFSVISYFVRKRKSLPCTLRWIPLLLCSFHDTHLTAKVQWFSATYNITFLVFLVFLILIGNISIISISKVPCAIIAGVSYYLYLVCIVLSITKVFVVTDTLGNWKPKYSILIRAFAGSEESIIWPLFCCFFWPSILVLAYALVANGLFQRNDNLCWIRTDYYFGALWSPLLLLLLTIPFYIPLISRWWPTPSVCRWINKLCVQDMTQLKTASEWEKEFCELRKIDINASNSMPYSVSRICVCLLVPQILLGLPAIFESATLNVIYLSVYHVLFILSLVLHLCIYLVIAVVTHKISKRMSDNENNHAVNETESIEQSRSSSQSLSIKPTSDIIPAYVLETEVIHSTEVSIIEAENEGGEISILKKPVMTVIRTVINGETGSIIGDIQSTSENQIK